LESTVSIDNGGWAVSKTSVDILLPRLRAQLATMDVNTPEVIYCRDNSCFKVTISDGDLLSKSKADKKCHVAGDLAVIPISLLSSSLSELERIIQECGPKMIYILSPTTR
jgi:hypothetical protein